MPTKLSRICDGVMEAAWLAAVIVVPVFFDVYSSRIFEPDKISLLRTLALLILAAWVIKLLEEGKLNRAAFRQAPYRFKSWLGLPLFALVFAFGLLYIISSLFSITPAASFWGSYQRLQGTYTTFSYLIVFSALVINVRKRAQVERLITTIIFSSLPVSLYGILQHFQIDPVPWGGNVAVRVAANLGNSIFVAAFLIMVFPLTAVRALKAFLAILNDKDHLAVNLVRATAYLFIAALQLIALIFSGSRGPLLGWLAGSFFLFLVISLLWRQRWFTIGVVAVTLFLGGFLIVLNIPNGPLEGLRNTPGVGRLGRLLDPESQTGQVRVLIWQGASQLVLPHAPLQYPNGENDRFSFLRSLIGCGPESMMVAYNRFYPPELAYVESRNAAPDRSHNETWDSLVMTGVLGLVIYLALFGSIIYYGLKWLGLVTGDRQRNLFLILYISGGVISAVGFVLWKGAGFFGVGLPFGMILGVIAYLAFISLFGHYEVPRTQEEKLQALTVLGLLAVIVAHFVEINFGIAIAVTRTYFWVCTALLLVVGYILPNYAPIGKMDTSVGAPVEYDRGDLLAGSAQKKKRRAAKGGSFSTQPAWLQDALVGAGILAILLITLGFDFISIAQATTGSVWTTLWNSFVRLSSSTSSISFGVLLMIMTSWVVGAAVLSSESDSSMSESSPKKSSWVKNLAVVLGVSFGIGLIYWIWHATALVSINSSSPTNIPEVISKVGEYAGLLTWYSVFLLLVVFGLGFFLSSPSILRRQDSLPNATRAGTILTPPLLVFVLWLATFSNMRIIQADIFFKLADPFARGDTWPAAIAIYDRANELAPSEDYYYLFLGRAYLEEAKTINDPAQRDALMQQAESDLKKAQAINPLNTDHTANLARLYSLWAAATSDPQAKQERGNLSIDYFKKAVLLSPNNARLWDEYALVYLNVFHQPDEVYKLLSHSLQIDPRYDWTQALFAEYYLDKSRSLSNSLGKATAVEQAALYYREALKLATDAQSKLAYELSLGQLYMDNKQPDLAINILDQAVQTSPQGTNLWNVEQTLAQLYGQVGDKEQALAHADRALVAAPSDQQPAVQSLIDQLKGLP